MYQQTAKQAELRDLLASNAKEILAEGGGRSGKTFEFCRAMITRAIKEPYSRHIILRDKFIHVKQSIAFDTIPKVLNLCFPQIKSSFNKADWFLPLPNKSEVWIGGLDDKERTEKILGKEYSTIFFNELSQIEYQPFLLAKTRLAQKNRLIKKIYADCNPPKMSHWAYKYFKSGLDPITGSPHNNAIATIIMNPKDNIENIDPDYMKMLDNLPPLLRDRFRDGIWCSDETDIFRSEWLIPTEYELKDEDIGFKVSIIDPAFTEKTRETDNTCESSIVTVGITYDMLIHDLEVLHGMWSYGELKQKAVSVYNRHKNCSSYILGVEDVAAQKWLQQDLTELSPSIPAILVPTISDKITRAISVTDLHAQGRCRLNDMYLRNQLLGFPSGKLKDCTDAYVHCLRVIKSHLKEKLERPKVDPLQELKKDPISYNFWKQYQEEHSETKNGLSNKDFGL